MARERIAKMMARAGVASRRDVERLIAAGRITLDGAVVTQPGTLVDDVAGLALDGRPIAAITAARLWRYHKPAGLITTVRDPQGRPTVFEHLPKSLPRVIAVGRLDIDTEGLLLLTNDGALARYLEHPENGFARTYRVRAYGRVDLKALDAMRRGVSFEGVRYRPAQVRVGRPSGANVWLEVTLTEGKNREVKRLLAAAGLRVNRLIRIGYGLFTLDALERGAVLPVPARRLRELLPEFPPTYF